MPSSTPWCSSYWKGSLQVAFEYGRQLYFISIRLEYLKLYYCRQIICIDRNT